MKVQIKKIPSQPGIYRFLDESGRLLYIGKAKNLKNRVKSYFAKTAELTPAKQQMVTAIKKIQFTIVTNETEALLLERALINKYLPPYNVDLKDDKSWLYIMITKDEFPKVIITRKHKQQHQRGVFFGPYTSSLAARQTLRLLKRIFPFYAQAGPMVDLAKNTRSRLHLGRYLNEPLTNQKEWLKNIRLIKKFLSGKNGEFKKSLHLTMLKEAKHGNFERAAALRDQLRYLEIINQKQQVINDQNEVNEAYLAKVKKNYLALKQLQKILKLKKLPARIECYDISNIQGQLAVGSMVVLTDGQIDKSQYRKFKIKTVIGANDPAMIAEVIKRRLKNDWPKPDLFVIDGGPTQLNAAVTQLKRANLKLPIISLAKRDEEIYLPNEAIPIKLPKFSPALQLLQQIRDEAHRFAITYYRRRHSKNLLGLDK
ncbi:MAG: excinuclease ABC subunit UvrC [Candidatus Komeilibacteria bacterium]|nr:excinuclease ABC subunit UvrC [Candidatus Komeilibacteria bacterium]